MPSVEEIIAHSDDTPPAGAPDPFVVKKPIVPIAIAEYDPEWPHVFADLAVRIRGALGTRAIRVEHTGSTSVPGLPAKPIIDIDLMVADPNAESAWLPALEAAGFVLTVREPWWQAHRCLSGGILADGSPAPAASIGADVAQNCNVHVFGPNAAEPIRHIVFRDWLRTNDADRELYARTKREAARVATEQGERVMQYNARKQDVIREIYCRAFRAAGLLG